ncbi:hypothetical protein Q4506_10820 [Colwellia sp. 4_MG-2023]|jgi:hypothetical protein|uniref:hypothetical protein n=1 Tax=unclassified Colwellia TaxID=196834 RepID=UPI001C086CAF|nr:MULTISPECIES: hypothetical protein [unclassified Colwellia]MBU2925914.1 hypothetical protein [Colwellia sp. C2M11]MDO6488514.1 hypothetical protein [Colwellia sp. 6_MG-2023]MDO6507399.1 hypothetical protein [Colwellia sp. 5_MG-2023]MDO6556181.1 hypothetical protein [Colwellia sp. 4_MG-2023]MDO6652688.1 hypothetical protein [Colwellia sp. 3_MG-2023]
MKHTLGIAITLLTISSATLADNEMEKEPGLFTGKKGAFTILKTDNLTAEAQPQKHAEQQGNTSVEDIIPTAPALSKKAEFALFKKWKEHKENNTAQYQEFLLWLEYKEISH